MNCCWRNAIEILTKYAFENNKKQRDEEKRTSKKINIGGRLKNLTLTSCPAPDRNNEKKNPAFLPLSRTKDNMNTHKMQPTIAVASKKRHQQEESKLNTSCTLIAVNWHVLVGICIALRSRRNPFDACALCSALENRYTQLKIGSCIAMLKFIKETLKNTATDNIVLWKYIPRFLPWLYRYVYHNVCVCVT